MPGASGLDLQSRLNQYDFTHPIIFLTGDGDTESGVRAMKNGAVDFLSKPVDNTVLFASIENAIEKSRRERSRYVARQGAIKKLATLTDRESEVVESVVRGLRNKEIAFELSISEKTVKAHRGRAMHKIGAGSIIDLVRIWNLALKPLGAGQVHNL
jgi:FixJ family two-component response regulator